MVLTLAIDLVDQLPGEGELVIIARKLQERLPHRIVVGPRGDFA